MNIRRLEIRNFRSLREVIMDDLGDLVTIIGKNGSGKTGVIEALKYLFHEFDPGLETPLVVNDHMIWHCFDTAKPVEFRLTLHMTSDEQAAVAPPALLEKWRSAENSQALTLTRHISMTAQGALWRTTEIVLGEHYVIREGKATSEARPSEPDEDLVAVQHLDAESEGLEPQILAEEDGDGLPNATQPQQGQTEQAPPQAPSASQDQQDMHSDTRRLLSNLSGRLKNTLKVIPAVRSAPGSGEGALGLREPFISREMQKDVVQLHDTEDDTAAVTKFAELQHLVEDVLDEGWRLDFVGGRLYLLETDQRVPIWLTGGGHQEYLAFVHRLLERDSIFAIEEPESHLHYSLCRALFRLMSSVAKERQIILVTHSEHFLDFAHPTTNWVFEKYGKETKAVRAESTDQLRVAISGVGGKPADRLFPNTLLLVAGETEEAVVPIWLEKLGIATGLGGVEVSAFKGESDWRKAAARIEAYEGTQTRLFLMVDDHGAPLAEKAQGLGLAADHCLVLDGTVEDCYPLDKLSEAMVYVYGKDNMRDVQFDEEVPRVEDIQRILKKRLKMPSKRSTGWKRGLGAEVARRMSVDEMPTEVREFLTRLAD